MKNVELKVELRSPPAARAQCRILRAQRIGRLHQTDTYFRMPDGRLKRREAPGEPTEWIFYHRPDRAEPSLSNYTILSPEQARRRWGTHTLRQWLTVRKVRELWMLENVRIHLDHVLDLGRFIEFEAQVTPECDVASCGEQVIGLREAFAPCLGEPISASYCDLMEQVLAERS